MNWDLINSYIMSNIFDRFATCGTGYTLNYDSGECEVRRLTILIILLMLILFLKSKYDTDAV